MAESEMVERPDETEELGAYDGLCPHYATLERGRDGTVYFITWRYGTSSVLFAVRPDGSVWTADDFSDTSLEEDTQ